MRTPRLAGAVTLVLVGLLFQVAALPAQDAADREQAATAAGLTREQKEAFLLHAEIVAERPTKTGTTGSRRATLSDGTLTHDAHVQTIDVRQAVFIGPRGREVDFRDYWGFNVAGYRLNALLGLDIVPVTVERPVDGEPASVAWWVDDVTMDGLEFKESGFKAPASSAVADYWAHVRVFRQLIYDTDPNWGNMVIDEDWKVWIFDFTRAFRRWGELEDPEDVQRIGRALYERLRGLDEEAVEQELGPFLRRSEISGLLKRRDLIVKRVEELIEELGEAAVLITRPGF